MSSGLNWSAIRCTCVSMNPGSRYCPCASIIVVFCGVFMFLVVIFCICVFCIRICMSFIGFSCGFISCVFFISMFFIIFFPLVFFCLFGLLFE